MKGRNILIATAVFGIAVILYKLLLGFVLPIALFASLVYVLKFLLKGLDADPEEESSQIITNSEPNSLTDKIVEIKPIQADKTIEELKNSEKYKQVDKAESLEEDKTLDN
tara:strand:+ start:619 stop:948 length:330 start_codon:yes stop_codon:yes gene_type:complete